MNSKTLNKKIREIADDESYLVKGLGDCGKSIPYIGWFWREVNFNKPLTLGYTDGKGYDMPCWVGFMENNKWDYPEVTCTKEQSEEIKQLLVEAVKSPSNKTLQAVFDYIQTLRPKR